MSRPVTSTLWRLLETCHLVVYYAPERTQRYARLGLKGGWMGYFATRSAALGVVPASVVTACFYNFKSTMVERALPDAWRYTTPERAVQARLEVFDDAARRLLGPTIDDPVVQVAAELAVEAVQRCEEAGRPLFAAHASLPIPDPPHLRLFWASAALREYRGDGHNAALVSSGVDGCEANIVMRALGLVPEEQQVYRGWSEQDWSLGTERLVDRGWLEPGGAITRRGRIGRAEIESLTDDLADRPWSGADAASAARLIDALTPLAARIVTAGGIPYPNGVGVPPIPELAASR
jgi:hypothetical protein